VKRKGRTVFLKPRVSPSGISVHARLYPVHPLVIPLRRSNFDGMTKFSYAFKKRTRGLMSIASRTNA